MGALPASFEPDEPAKAPPSFEPDPVAPKPPPEEPGIGAHLGAAALDFIDKTPVGMAAKFGFAAGQRLVHDLTAPDVENPKTSGLEAAALGFGSTGSAGMGDVLSGLGGAATDVFTSSGPSGEDAKLSGWERLLHHYRLARDFSKDLHQTAETEHPLLSDMGKGGGLVAGAAALPVVGTGLKGAALTGGLVGGAAGFGSSEGDLTRGEVLPVLKDTLVGAGTGAALGPLGKTAGEIAGPAVNELADVGIIKAGLPSKFGKAMEGNLAEAEVAGVKVPTADIEKAVHSAYDKALAAEDPAGASHILKRYEDFISTRTKAAARAAGASPQEADAAALSNAPPENVTPAELHKFETSLNSAFEGGRPSATNNAVKILRSEISNHLDNVMKSARPQAVLPTEPVLPTTSAETVAYPPEPKSLGAAGGPKDPGYEEAQGAITAPHPPPLPPRETAPYPPPLPNQASAVPAPVQPASGDLDGTFEQVQKEVAANAAWRPHPDVDFGTASEAEIANVPNMDPGIDSRVRKLYARNAETAASPARAVPPPSPAETVVPPASESEILVAPKEDSQAMSDPVISAHLPAKARGDLARDWVSNNQKYGAAKSNQEALQAPASFADMAKFAGQAMRHPVRTGALMAAKAAAPTFAKGADLIGQALSRDPESLGAFGGKLMAASLKGPEALNVEQSKLSQTSPEYRQLRRELVEQSRE